jgi:parallel beta-helix repeat protein
MVVQEKGETLFMEKKTASAIMLTLLLASVLTLAFNIQPVKASGTVGVKAGDWIKCTYTISGWPSGTPYPEWLKVEFLSVEGTNATIRVTMRMSDGTEQSDTMTLDVAAGGGTFQGLSGFVIPANCTTGDSIYMTGYGNVTIAGETTGTYAGASRTVVYAGFSQYGTQLTYYWDKQTGVMVEASVTSGDMSATAKATETNMWQAETTETIYIRADGSIDPSDAPIITFDNITYTLTDNITSSADGIVVERDNIVIDGAGYTVEGAGAWESRGIYLGGRGNVTIENMEVGKFYWGIKLEESSNNSIQGNNITNNWAGIGLSWSSNNFLRDNSMVGNNRNFGVYGYEYLHFVQDVDSSNTVDGKAVYYWVNVQNATVPIDAGYVALVNCTSITVQNLNLTNNIQCILLAFSENSTITGNNIINDGDGIGLHGSSNNIICGNNITANKGYGIWMRGSSNNKIVQNNLISCSRAIDIEMYVGYPDYFAASNNEIVENNIEYREWGVRLSDASNNTLRGNNITGIFYPYSTGVYLYASSFNSIIQNTIKGGQKGMELSDSFLNRIDQNIISTTNDWRYGETWGISLSGSTLNIVIQNNITQNFYGLRIAYSYPGYRNAIYHNNFVNNTYHAQALNFPDNAWDIGYPSGGNYWSDYNGSDMLSGSYQNETGGDGIGDTPYVIDENNMDNYPLMEPWFSVPPVVTYIRADGSIDPSDVPIHRNGDIYTLTEDIYGSIVVERDNVVVDGAGYTLQGTGALDSEGILLSETNNVTIKNVEIKAFYTGITISVSSNNKLYRNKVANNLYAIRVYQSSNNRVVESNVTANIFFGIWHEHSSESTISRNNITNNYWGIVLWESSNNTISGNNITDNNGYGIALSDSSNSSISENTVKNSYYGMSLWSSSYSNIYHNNFINNTWQAQVYGNSSANIWDNGYPSGGNHWSDYTSNDIYSGPYQNEAGSDGIGDTPYIIDADNQDRYPLMRPWTLMPTVYTFSIVWEEETFTVSVASNSTVSNFAFNQPNKEISFYVTGPDGTIGFSNVTIPKQLLYGEPWSVLIDGISVTPTIAENETHSILYFTYTHSTHKIQIIGTYVIAPPPPPLSVSISPLSASILVGQSVTFTSTVSGGYTLYSYQWYLNSAPVSGATSASWTFTPTTSGIYYVHLKITDSKSNTAQSETARITVSTVPVGGYSIPIQVSTKAEPIIPYIALIATLTAIFTKLRPKTKRKR